MLRAEYAYPLKRFALKVVFLSAFALVQRRESASRSLVVAFVVSGMLCMWLAALNKASFLRERRFTYWDEAAGFFILSVLAALATAI